MRIDLDNKVVSLIDFIEDNNCDQSVVRIHLSNCNMLCYSFKIKACNNINIIAMAKIYDVNSDPLSLRLDTNNRLLEPVLSYNTVTKEIIYQYNRTIRYEDIVNNLNTYYTVFDSKLLSEEIKLRYRAKVMHLLDENFYIYLEKYPEYKNRYNNQLGNIEYVEEWYLRDKNITFDIANIHIKGFTSVDTDNLHQYLLNNSIINSHAQDYVNTMATSYAYDTLLYHHAESIAHRKILKSIKENPTDRIKLVTKIKGATNGVGKTLNVVTKTGDTFKVENRILSNKEFKTVKGYTWIPIDSVAKITYGKKTLIEF